MTDIQIINIVKKYLDVLLQNGIEIKKAILFGSHAKNEAKEDSDIDLILVSPLFDEDNDEYTGRIWRYTSVSDYRIEPIAIGEKRFNEDNISPLLEIVRREGIEIAI